MILTCSHFLLCISSVSWFVLLGQKSHTITLYWPCDSITVNVIKSTFLTPRPNEMKYTIYILPQSYYYLGYSFSGLRHWLLWCAFSIKDENQAFHCHWFPHTFVHVCQVQINKNLWHHSQTRACGPPNQKASIQNPAWSQLGRLDHMSLINLRITLILSERQAASSLREWTPW